jgi:hypothetical protein
VALDWALTVVMFGFMAAISSADTNRIKAKTLMFRENFCIFINLPKIWLACLL